jgi:hypothetical protein
LQEIRNITISQRTLGSSVNAIIDRPGTRHGVEQSLAFQQKLIGGAVSSDLCTSAQHPAKILIKLLDLGIPLFDGLFMQCNH